MINTNPNIEFNWSNNSIFSELIGGVIGIFIGICIFPYSSIMTIIFVMLSVLAFLGFFTKRDTVYIELTQFFLIINPLMVLDKPVHIEWSLLKGIGKITNWKIILQHSNGEKIRIALGPLNKNDKKKIIQLIKDKVGK